MGTTRNDIERDGAGARIIEGWEQLVKTTASKVIGKKLIVCNRAVKWWDEEVKEAITSRRKARARYTSSKTTTGWEEWGIAITGDHSKQNQIVFVKIGKYIVFACTVGPIYYGPPY